MNPKPQPNHDVYIAALARMTPEQRLERAFELSEMVRAMFEHGLRQRFPDLGEDQLQSLLRERVELCHNRNY